MKISVNTILSFFRFIIYLLDKREAEANKRAEKANVTITALIVAREKAVTEEARAQAAKRKLKELVI